VGKIPSYALTWTFFQQLKEARDKLTGRPATDFENTIMGCIASGTTVCIMIPLDTIKTRLVTQSAHSALSGVAYKGIVDCAVRVAREEGVRALYRGLTPRLVSVVPMIGIQFGVYEFMKKTLLERSAATAAGGTAVRPVPRRPLPDALLPKRPAPTVPAATPAPKEQQQQQSAALSDPSSDPPTYGATEALQEAAMEVAASPEVPFPAPRFLKRMGKLKLETKLSQARPSAKAKQ
jgi:Mitochondrial carrier protein